MQKTIFALSSGGLPSGVAIIRVSGPEVRGICMHLMGGRIPEARFASLTSIRDRNNQLIDSALVLRFEAPHSFTGEDCLEIHCHGGRAVVMKLLEELTSFPGARHAAAGEFTKRAFENGKIDLVEAEGLADLITAETEMQRRLATEQTTGGLSRLYNNWAERITHARAMIEAELDFSDEDDVPGSVASQVWRDMRNVHGELDEHLQLAGSGEIIRDGLKVVIVGAPNVGKSSLINTLSRRDVSIVTDLAGTTRDVLTVDMNLDGYAVRFFDTAGLRESQDPVEQEGIRRAKLAADEADVILYLEDLSAEAAQGIVPMTSARLIRVGTKSDLVDVGPETRAAFDVLVSVKSGTGFEALKAKIADSFGSIVTGNSLAIPARMRHVEKLNEARAFLGEALAFGDSGLDIRAELLRQAALSLGKITGTVDVEALLDVIFSKFCIGK